MLGFAQIESGIGAGLQKKIGILSDLVDLSKLPGREGCEAAPTGQGGGWIS